MMSGYELPTYSKSHNPVFATILLVIFVFIMCVVLLNCLIALMSGESVVVSNINIVVPKTLPAFSASLSRSETWRIQILTSVNCNTELYYDADAAAKVSDREGWQFQLSRALIIGKPDPSPIAQA